MWRQAPHPTLSRRRVGRAAGFLFVLGAILTVVTLAGPHRGVDASGVIGISIFALMLGVFCLLAPWDRWPRWTLAALVPIGLATISLGAELGRIDSFTYAMYFAVLFVWTGIALPRFTSIAVAPLAAVAYVVPLIRADAAASDVVTVATVIPMCVLIGESAAWAALMITRQETERERVTDAFVKEREATTRLREIDEMKNMSLQAVSHELRTPVAAIVGLSSSLDREPNLDESLRSMLISRITANAEKLARLLEDLLDIDRIQHGAVRDPDRSSVDLRELVDRVIQQIDPEEHRIDVYVEADRAWVDGPKVERILENLVVNAVKYAPRRSDIWVSLLRSGPAELTLAVEQEGPPIPEEMRAALFEPFHRGRSDHRAPGTGIGLTLVRQFAEIHGGKAWIEDRAGGGVSVKVTLADVEPGSARRDAKSA